MTHLRTIAALAGFVLLPACTDYATFVTATNIGISADTTTQDLSIGFTRTELFTGPAYPQQGEAPAAVGFLHSDLSLQPHIKQLYATGDAAGYVTENPPNSAQTLEQQPPRSQPPAQPPSRDGYYGERRPLVFGTGTNFGLKVGFSGGAAPAPTSLKFGYNREEVSIIPLRHDQPTADNPEKYAPVLAALDMDLSASTISSTSLSHTQFFAIGAAARNLARNPRIRGLFEDEAKNAVQSAVKYSFDDLSRKIEKYWKPNGTVDKGHEASIDKCMTDNKISGNVFDLMYNKTDSERSAVASCLGISS